MKYVCILFFALATLSVSAQAKTQQLPLKYFITMHDSTNAVDVVFMTGKGGSLSIDGRNVQLFNSFFENTPAKKTGAPQAGNAMWQINGREFVSGNFYLGEKTGYIVFTKDGKEYVNEINEQGNTFFKNQVK
ncbi:MAG: hypothetical protein JWO06_662 [Bacteroidota bacterium]|nr:hypothetical protein [Bacteroidota bacterium]